MFAEGVEKFVCLCGPTGWGKSLLINQLVEESTDRTIKLVAAKEWLEAPESRDHSTPIIVDDVSDIARTPRDRYRFRAKLQRRMRYSSPTMIVAGSQELIADLLPASSFWHMGTMNEPTASEKVQIVGHLAQKCGLTLSYELMNLIARHTHGNGRSLVGALQRMGLVKRDWLDPADVCRACGVLMPYMLGSDGWDPRDCIYEAIQAALPRESLTIHRNVAAYLMLNLCQLQESDVACFLHITPTSAYLKAKSIESSLSCPERANLVERAHAEILRRFCNC